ncbi:MAG TPA: hypothetical protein PLO05_04040 [Bacteroidales bacterium]|nr:hypothetical protein [Bacteroidales bacterium]
MNIYIKIFVLFVFSFLSISNGVSQSDYRLRLNIRGSQNQDYSFDNRTKTFQDSLLLVNYLSIELEKLFEEGFIAAGYDSICWCNEKKVKAWLTKGEKYKFEKLSIQIDSQRLSKVLKTKRLENKALSLNKILFIRRQVVNFYENIGYPFCEVWFDSICFGQDNYMKAKLNIELGEVYVFDSLIAKGDTKTKVSFIESYINWTQNSKYSEKYLMQINQNLSELEFIEQGKPFELAFRNGKTDILLYLKDKGANNFSGILGIMPNNNVTGKMVLTGDVDLLLKNILGRGEHFWLNWKKYEAASQQLSLSFAYPFVFRTRLGAGVDFEMEKQDSSYFNTDVKAKVNYFLNGLDGIGVFYQNITSYTLTKSSESNYNDFSANLWGLSYVFQNFDYVYNPRKGYSFDFNIAGGVKNHSDNLEIDASEKSSLQVRTQLYTNFYIPVLNKFSVKISEQAAYIYDQHLYTNELYRIGGFKNFRGVDELSIMASLYAISSVELRYLFEQNSAFYLFSDFAYVQNSSVRPIYSDLPYSFGLGLDLFTNAGIFTLNYGVAATNNQSPEFRSAKIHIGYRNRF